MQSPETQAPGDGHDVLSHAHVPLLVSQGPDAHTEHARPAAPHEAFVCNAYATHAPLLQQPVAHELGLHPEEPLDEPEPLELLESASFPPPDPELLPLLDPELLPESAVFPLLDPELSAEPELLDPESSPDPPLLPPPSALIPASEPAKSRNPHTSAHAAVNRTAKTKAAQGRRRFITTPPSRRSGRRPRRPSFLRSRLPTAR